jgi:N-sulfoglucosamine sulfohydrolase
VNPNLVSYVDVLPTILEWTLGPEFNQLKSERAGRSFLPVLGATERLAEWDHVFGSHTFHESTNYWPTRYIRTRRYKYHRNIAWRLDFPFANDIYGSLTWEDIRNADTEPKMIGQRPLKDYFFRPAEQLFDLDNDPAEVKDLAKDPESATVLEDLRTRLEDWQRRTNDPWLYRDGISILLNKHHLDAGLAVPDKWDLDVDNPETKGDAKMYDNKPFGIRGPRS